MKKLILLLAILPLTACFDGDKDQSKSKAKLTNGTFKATVGDKQYNLPIGCRDFESGNNDTVIWFYSDIDKAGNLDSDGDGIMVQGSRIIVGKDKSPIPMDGISVSITDHGVRYENNIGTYAMTGSKQNWVLNPDGISGTDVLYEGEDMNIKKHPISYEVICK